MSAGEEDGDETGVFENCTKLETVKLPNSLRKIGSNTFDNCKALVHVDIPAGVNEIGRCAFNDCCCLRTVTIPEGVLNLPVGVFAGCKSLESAKLPSSLRTIEQYAFSRCVSLTAINFDALEGVTDVARWAFYECLSLTTLKLPPSLKTIEEGTFNGCRSLSKVELPPLLETIKTKGFEGCCHPSLTIDLPEAVTNIESLALKGCRVGLPASLSILSGGGDARGLLQGVKEVVMSSRVNLGLLVRHVNGTPTTDFDPTLTFKVLYSGRASCSAPPPPLSLHVPSSYSSLSVPLGSLGSIPASRLHDAAGRAFAEKNSIYAGVLSCKRRDLPSSVLHHILPLVHGRQLKTGDVNRIVEGVNEILRNGAV